MDVWRQARKKPNHFPILAFRPPLRYRPVTNAVQNPARTYIPARAPGDVVNVATKCRPSWFKFCTHASHGHLPPSIISALSSSPTSQEEGHGS